MKKYRSALFALLFTLIAGFSLLTVSAESVENTENAEDEKRLFDDAGVFGAAEYAELNSLLLKTEESCGFTVSVLISGDVGADKSDRAVVDYADVYYERNFGLNTDGVLFLINNDTEYDYISTSGICMRYFTDKRISGILDYVSPLLKAGDYYGAVEAFAERVPQSQYTEYAENMGYTEAGERGEKLLYGILGGLAASVIAVILIIVTVNSRYKIKSVKHAVNYLDNSSVRFTQKSDTFIRIHVSKIRIESHSGGSGHHSSGGGMHGGGGRHR